MTPSKDMPDEAILAEIASCHHAIGAKIASGMGEDAARDIAFYTGKIEGLEFALASRPTTNEVSREEFEIVRTASRLFEDASNKWMERALKAEAPVTNEVREALAKLMEEWSHEISSEIYYAKRMKVALKAVDVFFAALASLPRDECVWPECECPESCFFTEVPDKGK